MDAEWQTLWWRLIVQVGRHYNMPLGRVGQKWIAVFANEIVGVRHRLWNSKRPLVFLMVVLQRKETVTSAEAINRCLLRHLDLWDHRRNTALTDDTEVEMWCHSGSEGVLARDF